MLGHAYRGPFRRRGGGHRAGAAGRRHHLRRQRVDESHDGAVPRHGAFLGDRQGAAPAALAATFEQLADAVDTNLDAEWLLARTRPQARALTGAALETAVGVRHAGGDDGRPPARLGRQ